MKSERPYLTPPLPPIINGGTKGWFLLGFRIQNQLKLLDAWCLRFLLKLLNKLKLHFFKLSSASDLEGLMGTVVTQFPGCGAPKRLCWDPREREKNKLCHLVVVPTGLIKEQTHFNCVHSQTCASASVSLYITNLNRNYLKRGWSLVKTADHA